MRYSTSEETAMMTGIVPRTFVRALDVNGKEVLTNFEGYILNRNE